MPTSIAAPDVSIALPGMPYGGFSPVRLQGRFIRQGLPLRHRQQCRVVCVHPSCPPLPSSVSSSCVEGRCAFEHHRSSGLHRFTPGALAPTRLCSPGLRRLSGPIRPTRHLAAFSLPGRLYVASLLCRHTASCAAYVDDEWFQAFDSQSFLTCHPLRPRGDWYRGVPVSLPNMAFAYADRGSALPSNLRSASRR